MKPVNPGGHAAYQSFLVSHILEIQGFMVSIDAKMMELANHFFQLDFSFIDILMQDFYSKRGSKPRLPSCMLRCIMLSLMLHVPSFTEWAALLKRVPLYAIISGFEPGRTPSVGTFYDFYKRLWRSDDADLTGHIRKPKKKPKKPPKGKKAEPVEKITVKELIDQYLETPFSDEQPYSLLFSLYYEGFLKKSAGKGLINLDCLRASGDGTPVYTSVRMRSRHLTGDETKASTAPDDERYFSQPDCDIGWDSSREGYYHGYDLYLFTAAESDEDKKTLPIFPLLDPASMHDSIGFVHAYFAMQAFLHPSISELCLNSAHDNMATYRLCQRDRIAPSSPSTQKGRKPLKSRALPSAWTACPSARPASR